MLYISRRRQTPRGRRAPTHATLRSLAELLQCIDQLTLQSVTLQGVLHLPDRAFLNWPVLRLVSIPDALTIGEQAFAGCRLLQRVQMSSQLLVIGHQAFCNCTRIAKLPLPDSLIRIGCAAFRSCARLREMTLPESLQVIGGSAFRNCVELRAVHMPESLQRTNHEQQVVNCIQDFHQPVVRIAILDHPVHDIFY
jgi:hypothetical protein